MDCHISKYRKYFLEFVLFQFHARMRSSEVAQSLKSYGHLSDHGIETALSHCHRFISYIYFFKCLFIKTALNSIFYWHY